ncbi:PLP-dependent aminotransferase family protein [Pseudescherichia sp.]|uniref:MocR-like pyridoxine biosynthesis transcription factor PdxR n=1 Tax=Pseudescherichia sp. TaxID=2055881 RepID=UPI0028B19C32|nr:PLP-dependent aminotransferase family protein [Pseudescherichia sp.]
MDARYQQIARQLKAAITSGELKTGSRLPSSRTWAQENGVSRTTVEQAYGELVAQGWLERRGQAGTFVSQTSPLAAAVPIAHSSNEHEPKPFQMGLPALDLFPRALWARLTSRRLRTQSRFDLTLGDPAGEAMLRQAIADYLRFSRSIECQPEQIFITSGYAQSMSLILQTLASPGDGMWMEDPGFPLIYPAIDREGVQRFPVPVDQNGMDIDAAIARWPQARFALLTPAHQSPLGVALSLPRRRQVLAWAAENSAWIIEDDYDSEFRYHGRPLPPLKSLDAPQRVIYTGTFSKSLFPAIRTAWIVVPAAEAATFRQRINSSQCSVPTLWQYALADFIQQGHFWRHLKKMRLHYAQRRAWLEAALIHYGFNVVPQHGGIQLVVAIDGDDKSIVARAQLRGLAVQALSDWHSTHPVRSGILMSFTNITSAEMAMKWVGRLQER